MAKPQLNAVPPLSRDFATKAEYELALATLQERLLHIQQALYHAGERAIVVFEGADASGKGALSDEQRSSWILEAFAYMPSAPPLPKNRDATTFGVFSNVYHRQGDSRFLTAAGTGVCLWKG